MPREWLPSRLPIIQAPMAGSQGVELCVAVCEAGGLGSIPSAMLTPAILRDQIAEIRARTQRAVQRQLLLPRAARARSRSACAMARAPRGRLRRGGPRSVGCGKRPRTRAVRRRDGGGRRGHEAPGRELPFRPAGCGAPRAGEGCGSKDLFLRDHSRRGALARSARRRRCDRARGRGRRPSRHVPERGRRRPAGPGRAAAAGRRRGSRSGHRGWRDRRRTGRGRRFCAWRACSADRHSVLVDAAGDDDRAASRGASRSERQRDAAHQSLHRPPGARPCQPLHARPRADERRRARLSPCVRRGRALARLLGEVAGRATIRRFGPAKRRRSRARRTPARSPSGCGARPRPHWRRSGSNPEGST